MVVFRANKQNNRYPAIAQFISYRYGVPQYLRDQYVLIYGVEVKNENEISLSACRAISRAECIHDWRVFFKKTFRQEISLKQKCWIGHEEQFAVMMTALIQAKITYLTKLPVLQTDQSGMAGIPIEIAERLTPSKMEDALYVKAWLNLLGHPNHQEFLSEKNMDGGFQNLRIAMIRCVKGIIEGH